MNHFISKYLFYYPTTLARGEFIAQHLNFYENFQWKDENFIKNYQFGKLKELLQYSIKNSAYYKKTLLGLNLDINSIEDLQALPFLTKNDLISKSNEINTHRLYASKKTTGGSTGQAVTIFKNSGALARERAATWRSYRWAGVDIGDPQARFWGVPITKKQQHIYNLIDFIANRKRFSAFAFNQENLHSYIEIIHKFKPVYLYGYASMIYELALFSTKNKYTLPSSVRSIITTSEVLTAEMRGKIEQVFNLKVFNEYGCGEVGSIAHECEQGHMHIMSDNLILEIIDENGQPASTGEIVVTDLFNYSMPLIRYRLGDYASIDNQVCSCGRTLPIISGIHGRAYDLVKSSNGKTFHPEIVMYIFEQIKEEYGGIKQFQFIQKSYQQIDITIVKDETFKPELENTINEMVHKKIDPSFQINFIYQDSISREKSGKLRLIKSEIN